MFERLICCGLHLLPPNKNEVLKQEEKRLVLCWKVENFAKLIPWSYVDLKIVEISRKKKILGSLLIYY